MSSMQSAHSVTVVVSFYGRSDPASLGSPSLPRESYEGLLLLAPPLSLSPLSGIKSRFASQSDRHRSMQSPVSSIPILAHGPGRSSKYSKNSCATYYCRNTHFGDGWRGSLETSLKMNFPSPDPSSPLSLPPTHSDALTPHSREHTSLRLAQPPYLSPDPAE